MLFRYLALRNSTEQVMLGEGVQFANGSCALQVDGEVSVYEDQHALLAAFPAGVILRFSDAADLCDLMTRAGKHQWGRSTARTLRDRFHDRILAITKSQPHAQRTVKGYELDALIACLEEDT